MSSTGVRATITGMNSDASRPPELLSGPGVSPSPAAPPEIDPASRRARLETWLSGQGRVLVAYSGGVDSSFLLRVAHDVLGERVLGVLARSPSLDRQADEEAVRLAGEQGWPLRVIETHEYDNEAYRRNDSRRCYFCKSELFTRLAEMARQEGFDVVLDGSNEDDRGDHRPGTVARDENGVRSPLQELGFTKAHIRELSRQLGLPTWDRPASPCLASRIPYGQEVSDRKLRQVETTERALRDRGFLEVRVRHHGEEARIEVPPADFPRLLEPENRQAIVEVARGCGFTAVTLDLEGFRSGKLNDSLDASRAPAPARAPLELERLRPSSDSSTTSSRS